MTRAGALAILVWATFLGAAGHWLSRHLVVTTDVSAFLPAAVSPAQALLAAQLREGVASRMVLVGIEGDDPRAAARASRALAAALAADPRFGVVANGDASRFAAERDLVWRWRYLLSPTEGLDRFAVDGLRAALDESLRLFASPLGPAIRGTMAADPTGETRAILAAGAGGEGRALREGVWFDAAGRRALLVVATRAPGFDIEAQQAAARGVRDAFGTIATPGLDLVMTSPGLLAGESRRLVERDAQVASTVTGMAVLGLLYLVYRSVWPVLLSALPALTGMAAGIVAVSAAFGPVHALTLGFGALLIGEAVDYPTYLFANNDPGETLESTAARIGRTLLLACATTACGAVSMLLSGFAGLAQLGTLTMVGVLVAGAVTFRVLPALTPPGALSGKRVAPPPRARAAFDRAPAFAAWLIPALALAAWVVFAHRDALWDDNLANLSPVPESMKALDRDLRAQSGSPDLRYLVVARGADLEAALEASERVAVRLDRAVERGMIGGFDLAARTLPSRRTQQARQEALPDRATLARSLDAALAESPFRASFFAPFLDDVERARTGPLLRAADLQGTGLAARLDSLLLRDGAGMVALVPLTGVTDAAGVADLVAGDAAVAMLDLKAELDGLVAGYRGRALLSAAFGAACIALVTALGLRSMRRALGLLVPVLCAVVFTVAALLAFGQRLTVFHLVSLLFVVGVGVNYALFFDFRRRSPEGADLTLLSVAVAGLASLIASGTLASAATPALSAIGMTTGLGAIFAFATCAVLARGRAP